MSDYENYEGLVVERPEDGILRIAMRAEKTGQQHGDLGEIFLEAGRSDPSVRCVLVGPDNREGVDRRDRKGEATFRLMREVAGTTTGIGSASISDRSTFSNATRPGAASTPSVWA